MCDCAIRNAFQLHFAVFDFITVFSDFSRIAHSFSVDLNTQSF